MKKLKILMWLSKIAYNIHSFFEDLAFKEACKKWRKTINENT